MAESNKLNKPFCDYVLFYNDNGGWCKSGFDNLNILTLVFEDMKNCMKH